MNLNTLAGKLQALGLEHLRHIVRRSNRLNLQNRKESVNLMRPLQLLRHITSKKYIFYQNGLDPSFLNKSSVKRKIRYLFVV